jgi:hypothetical protein
MGFGQELLSIGNALFRLAEIVGEREYTSLDEIADWRHARLVAASENLKGLVYGLQRHFSADPDLMKALASVKQITDYLLFSFQSALAYKLPYSDSNPFGLSMDLNQIDEQKQCPVSMDGRRLLPAKDTFTSFVVNLHRLVAMQMLMVHFFAIEFTVLAAHIHGCRHSPPLLDLDFDDKYQALMRRMHKYLQGGIREIIEREWQPVPATFTATGEMLTLALGGILDQDLTFIADPFAHAVRVQSEMPDKTHSPILHRQFVFQLLMMALDRYKEDDDALLDKKIYTYSENLYRLLLDEDEQCFPRRFMESNPRDRLAKKFRSVTPDPCFEYQAKPSSQKAGSNDYKLFKVGGEMEVQHRRVVKIWKHELKWQPHDWIKATVVHGEAHLMANLLYSLAPVVLGNRAYRRNQAPDMSVMHSMLTRFYGPFYFIDRHMETEQFKEEMRGVRSINDPVRVRASSLQPMPSEIQKWAIEVHRVYENYARHYVSDAVFAPAMSLSTVEQLPRSTVDPLRFNVRWLRLRLKPEEQNSANIYKFMNSLFLLHYGDALQALQPSSACHATLKVLGSADNEPLRLDNAAYGNYNVVPERNNMTPVQYATTPRMIADIKRLQSEFKQQFSKRGSGFLHPACWLHPDLTENANTPYIECDSSDVIADGVRIRLPTGDDEDEEVDAALNDAMHLLNCERVDPLPLPGLPDGSSVSGDSEGGDGEGGGHSSASQVHHGDGFVTGLPRKPADHRQPSQGSSQGRDAV